MTGYETQQALADLARIGNAIEDLCEELPRAVMRAVLLAAHPKPDAPAPDPTTEREKRLAECRARAWAAYKAAGGVLGAEADDPPRLPPDTELWNLGMSIRARKAMVRLKVNTLGELAGLTADELLQAKNFGQTTLREVRAMLARHGLALRGDSEPQGT